MSLNKTLSPPNLPLKDYESFIERRQFWDDFACEYNDYTQEKKLVILAGFVNIGGNLKKIIKQYAKDHDEIYRQRIHWVILHYIWRLIMGNDTMDYSHIVVDRIKCLDNDELIQLLTEELKKRVEKDCTSTINISTSNINETEHWVISDKEKYNDEILDKIERKHWQTHPKELYSTYLRKGERWENKACLF